jgi:hypothetical protein
MRAVLSRCREWWPELLCGSLCLMFAGIGIAQAGENRVAMETLAGFTAFAVTIGWAMGHRHRMLPLHRKVDRLTDGVTDLVDEVRSDREGPAAGGGRPELTLHKGGAA